MGTGFYLGVIIFYAIAMVIIGIVLRKQANKSMADYGLASNRFGTGVVALVSIGAWVGSGGLLGLASSGYTDGVMGYWEYAMGYICILPFVFLFAAKVKVLNLYTIPEFFTMRYSKFNGFVCYPTGVLFLVRNATTLGMQLNALAFLFAAFFGWEHVYGVLVSAIIVVIYTAMSGFLSVMVTNFVQSIFQTLAPFLALGFVIWYVGGWDQVTAYYDNIGQAENLSLFNGTEWIKNVIYYFFTTGLFFLMSDQGDWQRIGSSKTAKTAKNSLLIGTILVLPVLAVPCFVGAGARLALGNNVESDMVFYELIKIAGPVVGALLIIGVLSTIMSATSSFLFAGGMNVSKDIIIQYMNKSGKKVSEKQEIFISRIGVIICCLVGIGFAVLITDLLELWGTGLSICAAGLIPPFLFAWFSKRANTEGALTAMIGGGGAALAWTLLGTPFDINPIWIGLPISVLACLIVPLFTAPPTQEEVNTTYFFNEKFKDANKK